MQHSLSACSNDISYSGQYMNQYFHISKFVIRKPPDPEFEHTGTHRHTRTHTLPAGCLIVPLGNFIPNMGMNAISELLINITDVINPN